MQCFEPDVWQDRGTVLLMQVSTWYCVYECVGAWWRITSAVEGQQISECTKGPCSAHCWATIEHLLSGSFSDVFEFIFSRNDWACWVSSTNSWYERLVWVSWISASTFKEPSPDNILTFISFISLPQEPFPFSCLMWCRHFSFFLSFLSVQELTYSPLTSFGQIFDYLILCRVFICQSTL